MHLMISKTNYFVESPPGVRCYVLFTFGYHASDIIVHLFRERENDYREMLLHHIAAMGLYISFITANCFAVGTIIAFLHDWADIFVSASRLGNCLGLRTPTVVTFIGLLIVWFYTRTPVLGYFIYTIHYHMIHPEPSLQITITFNNLFLCIMFCIHQYWFVKLVGIITKVATKGEIKDTINNLEEKKE